jgi:hypothetical protein
MAMTAWSAKVLSSPISEVAKAPGCVRLTTMAPTGSPPRSIGIDRTERNPLSRAWRRNSLLHDGSVSTSATWCVVFVNTVCSGGKPTMGGCGAPNRSVAAAALPGAPPRAAAMLFSSPSYRTTATPCASNRRNALSAMASKTGCVSFGEFPITLRISPVAASRARTSLRDCCSSGYDAG